MRRWELSLQTAQPIRLLRASQPNVTQSETNQMEGYMRK